MARNVLGTKKDPPYNPLMPLRNYLDSEGHDTGRVMSFSMMCKEIDDNYHKKLHIDPNRIINLMYSVIFMLACKKKYFKSTSDYDIFAWELTMSIWSLEERTDGSIKNFLDYVKGIINLRAIDYLKKEFHISDPDKDRKFNSANMAFIHGYSKNLAKEQMEGIRNYRIKDMLKEVPGKIEELIPSMLNGKDRKNAKISVWLTINYGETMLWDLGEEWRGFVEMVVADTKKYIMDELRDIEDMYEPSDGMVNILQDSLWESDVDRTARDVEDKGK